MSIGVSQIWAPSVCPCDLGQVTSLQRGLRSSSVKRSQQLYPSRECQERWRKELLCVQHSTWHTVGAMDRSWYLSQELHCEGRGLRS